MMTQPLDDADEATDFFSEKLTLDFSPSLRSCGGVGRGFGPGVGVRRGAGGKDECAEMSNE
jgi:hypothetical protein